MQSFFSQYASLFGTGFAVVVASFIIFMRVRATKKPTSARKIIIPPLGMSTGFLMFLVPEMRIPWLWGIGAFLAGAIFFSIPLIRTSRFEVIEGEIYLKRSKAFILILIVLFAIRMGLHNYVEQHISIAQTGAVFFLLAFGMLLPWRLAMFYRYKQMEKQHLAQTVVSS